MTQQECLARPVAHMNLQVASVDHIFRSWRFLVDHGVEIEMGRGPA